jgi:hypothetical protein
VIARALCHYRSFDLANVPAHKRGEALAMQLGQWSPFAEAAHCVVWRGSRAQAWVWDRAAQQEAMREAGVKQASVLPESLLRPRPAQDGARLLACLEGVEGQFWRNGALELSRWWPQAPALKEWQYFLRACGLPLSDPPTPLELPLGKPWGRPQAAPQSAQRWEPLAVTATAALLIAIAAWQLAAIWQWQQGLAEVRARATQFENSVAPVLQARTAALADRQAIEKLQALNADPAPLELFLRVAEKLPPGVELEHWSYQTGELKFTVVAQRHDAKLYVETFQALPQFREVKAETGRSPQHLIVSMKLVAAATTGG